MHLLAVAAASILLGLHGDPSRFQSQTGQQTQIVHIFVSFAQTNALAKIVANAGPVPMLALNAGAYGAAETATPRGLALGHNDAFLIRLNGVINDSHGATWTAAEAMYKAHTRRSRSRFPNGGSGATAPRTSSATWRDGCAPIGAPS